MGQNHWKRGLLSHASIRRLLKYANFDTASSENSPTTPSTPGQLALGRALVEEMRDMGIPDARIDEMGYVYGSIPETIPGQPAIGLIAHMDTASCVPCRPMRARLIDYRGGEPKLDNGDSLGDLSAYAGQQLVLTDGNTLLGADDKAGIAEILTAAERLLEDPSLPHGKVCIAFTPDEEIGRGADHFDLAGFGADFAYTVDGGELGEVEYECFNAANGKLRFTGRSTHPGAAKGTMKNALRIAAEFISLLPCAQAPENTEGYEGFYHVDEIRGTLEQVTLALLVRDHDRALFEKRKALVRDICRLLDQKHGAGSVELDLRDSYYNMAEVLKGRPDILHRAKEAMRAAGITPRVRPIRGGTDDARLSFMGLPCPNLSTGGMNGHSRQEWISIQAMDTMVRVLCALVSPPQGSRTKK
ncbi:MAG: peptidase T [Clostridiales bacterium]|nr:peptidase T [Bacillota bacterium]NLL55451.1 peptidase T [Clostridiales bacterium]